MIRANANPTTPGCHPLIYFSRVSEVVVIVLVVVVTAPAATEAMVVVAGAAAVVAVKIAAVVVLHPQVIKCVVAFSSNNKITINL